MQTAKEVWAELLAGNARFAEDAPTAPHRDRARREALIGGQHPKAAVIACSDSRVPVELLFDVGFGDLFVIRTAGGCVDEAVAASVDYAVTSLGVPLVVVLSHASCGAVAAAKSAVESADMPRGLSRVIVEKVGLSVIEAQSSDAAEIEAVHARVTAQGLAETAAANVGVVAARYVLGSGRVEPVWEHMAD